MIYRAYKNGVIEMKKIYFVQVGFDFDESVYLPYAVGTIIAYCNKHLCNKNDYSFSDIIFTRKKQEDVLEQIKNPYIVAFSCNVWNIEYNKALAKAIKVQYPDAIIIFGGHNVSESENILETEEYVDILIYGEGEITFCRLLENLSENRLSSVKNIAYRNGKETFVTPREYYFDMSDFPSPYTTGVFDSIINENPKTDFLAVLETNRGCPYNCAYCDWCAGHKIRFFPMNKILDEIRWLSENKISYCFCADSNFGMFPRDYDIAMALIDSKKRTGYPEIFRPCYEKNSAERVFQICSAFNEAKMDKGATFAYQTLSSEALQNIGRKNLTLEHFSSFMQMYNQANIPTYSELILGLPGETLHSFCTGICRLIENGQHNSISVYHCEVLPNSDLASAEFIDKFNIEVAKVEFNHIHSKIKEDEQIQEYSYIVRSTNTMSRDDWVTANLFSICVQCFHSLGILRCFALYLYNEKIMSYYEFYSKLFSYIMTQKNNNLHYIWMEFKKRYESSLSGKWNYTNSDFGNVTWFFEEGAFLEIVKDYDEYYSSLRPFIDSLNIDSEISDEMLKYQKKVIRKPNDSSTTFQSKFNFKEYFDGIIKSKPVELHKSIYTYQIIPNAKFDNMEQYAKEVVWFGRRVGKSLYSFDEIAEIKFRR